MIPLEGNIYPENIILPIWKIRAPSFQCFACQEEKIGSWEAS